MDYDRIRIAEKKVKRKLKEVVITYAVRDILFALYSKVLKFELVTFT